MRVSFRHADFDALASTWNHCAPAEYRLSASTLRRHTVESPLFDWGASLIWTHDGHVQGFVAIKQSAASLYKGPDPDTAHITAIACNDSRCAVDILAECKSVLRNRGVYRLAMGQDSGHLLAGCPTDWVKLADLLTIEGFQDQGEAIDLTHDLADYTPPCTVTADIQPITEERIPLLREFLEREFPHRWRYDTMTKIEMEGRADFVYGLFLNGRCEGFAVTQDAGQEFLIGGAVFIEPFGADWCTLGPIGISQSIRGKGLGDQMLAGALLALKAKGGRKCLIDWTTLDAWYGRHGFQPARRYRSMVLRLDDLP